MAKLLYTIASTLIFLVGCEDLRRSGGETPKSAGPHAMTCSPDLLPVGLDAVFRCENKEIVCYVGDGLETMALACKWKDAK